MKKSARLFLMVHLVGLLVALACYLSLKSIEKFIINDTEVLVQEMAQSILPSLLAGDEREVARLIRTFEAHPSIQSAELISGSGATLAAYSRDGLMPDIGQEQFALASIATADTGQHLYVTAPLTFDTQILANLHIAVNLWAAYVSLFQWMGLLLLVLSAIYVLFQRLKFKIRIERVFRHDDSDYGDFNVNEALQTAMRDADMTIEYQPIKRLSDRGVWGAEVVVCWKHPSGQTLYVTPADFIALAECSGLSLPFETWILESACQQMARWQHKYGPLILSLGISSSQFKSTEFYTSVRKICDASHYPYQLIDFQINESTLLQQQDGSKYVEDLAQKGVNFTVLKFGLSPHSQEILTNCAIQKVKFSGQLIRNIEHDQEMHAFVQELSKLASQKDVQLTADGLHSESQLELILRMGGVLGQGPLIGQPMSSKQFEALLVSQAAHFMAQRLTPTGHFHTTSMC